MTDPFAAAQEWIERTLGEELPFQHPGEREALASALHVHARESDAPVDGLILWLHQNLFYDSDWQSILTGWREECARYRAARKPEPAA